MSETHTPRARAIAHAREAAVNIAALGNDIAHDARILDAWARSIGAAEMTAEARAHIRAATIEIGRGLDNYEAALGITNQTEGDA